MPELIDASPSVAKPAVQAGGGPYLQVVYTVGGRALAPTRNLRLGVPFG